MDTEVTLDLEVNEQLPTTKKLMEQALQMGVAMVEVREALEEEAPKRALNHLILSKKAYVWTDKGKKVYTPQPHWLPGEIRPLKKVEPEQRLSLWKHGKFGVALETKLITLTVQQKEQEIDLFACCQMTQVVRKKIVAWNPRSTKLAVPPFNMKSLVDTGALNDLQNGYHELQDEGTDEKVVVKQIDIPCYGPDLHELIRDLLDLDIVRKTATELRVMLPKRLIDEVVREKCLTKGREFVSTMREDAIKAGYEKAVDKLVAFINRVEHVEDSDFVNRKYEPHDNGYAWVDHHLGPKWREQLDVHAFLRNFGFPKEFIETKLGTKGKGRKEKSIEDAVKAVRWIVKAADIFSFPGSMADVVNLIFCMLRKDPDPRTALDIADVIRTVAEFKDILENGYWHRLEWVPNYMVHDSEMGDMVAWVLLHLVCSKKKQKFVCFVQLPGVAAAEKADSKGRAQVNAAAESLVADTAAADTARERAELDSMKLASLKRAAIAEGCNRQAVQDADDTDKPKMAVIALILQKRASQTPTSILDVKELQQDLEHKHKDQLDHLQQQYESRSTLRSTVIPFRDPGSKNLDHVAQNACLIPPQTIFIVSECEVRAFTGKYTWNGEMFESDRKRLLLHPMTGHWCFSLDVDGMSGTDKYYQIAARTKLCMPHNTLGWRFLVQSENRHSQLQVLEKDKKKLKEVPDKDKKKQKEKRYLSWEQPLTEITIEIDDLNFGNISLGVLRWSKDPNNRVLIAWQSDEVSWWNKETSMWENSNRVGDDLPKNKDEFESLWAAKEHEIEQLQPVRDQPGIRKSLRIGGAMCSQARPSTSPSPTTTMGDVDSMPEKAGYALGNSSLAELKRIAANNYEMNLKTLKREALELGCDASAVDDADNAKDAAHAVIELMLAKKKDKMQAELNGMKSRQLKAKAVEKGCDKEEVYGAHGTEHPRQTVIDLIWAKLQATVWQFQPGRRVVSMKSRTDCKPHLSMGDVGTVIHADADAIHVNFGGGLTLLLQEVDLVILEAERPYIVICESVRVRAECSPDSAFKGYVFKDDHVLVMEDQIRPVGESWCAPIRRPPGWIDLRMANDTYVCAIKAPPPPYKDLEAVYKSLDEAGNLIHDAGPPTPPPSKPIFDVWIPPASSPDKLPPCQFWVVDDENKNRWRCGLDATCDSFTRCTRHARKEENQLLKKAKHRCNFECLAYKSALAFLNELGVDVWIDHKWDRCYCTKCYGEDQPDKIAKDSSPDKFDYEQIAPRGWVGFGVVNSQHLSSANKEGRENWPIRFHGCNPNRLKDILRYGNLARPGDRLVDNVVMEATFRASDGDHSIAPVFYTSPSIAYAGLQVYARAKPIAAMPGKVGQVVLQCNQKETDTRIDYLMTNGAETMGFSQIGFPADGVCKYTSLYSNGIETISNQPDGCVIRRVLIRTFYEDKPPTKNKLIEPDEEGGYRKFVEPVEVPETFRSPIDRPKGTKSRDDDGTIWL